ncbi:leucine zipper domain-containing protein [Streptomyces sp. NPDC051020]|uniref:helix-turn-helix domain-containing protein n=1 Tax=Streptomyces sp. NPDC051020 TaxID=3155409 RepID=UPI0034485476
MGHRNAPLSMEGCRRLVRRCQTRPIAHVAAEMGISRACASKWVNRWRRHGEAGLVDRSSTPHRSPNATPAWAILQIGRRRFIDPGGESNCKPGEIVARWPGHMVHLDVKKVGRIPDGGGWRIHGRDSDQAKAADRAKSAGAKRGYVYLHSAIDGFSRLSYTEPLPDEKGATAAAFLARAKVWFAAHGINHIHRIVTDNGACHRSGDFARIVDEELLYAREFTSDDARTAAIAVWNIHYNYHRPHSGAGGQPPAARLRAGVTNVQPSYIQAFRSLPPTSEP